MYNNYNYHNDDNVNNQLSTLSNNLNNFDDDINDLIFNINNELSTINNNMDYLKQEIKDLKRINSRQNTELKDKNDMILEFINISNEHLLSNTDGLNYLLNTTQTNNNNIKIYDNFKRTYSKFVKKFFPKRSNNLSITNEVSINENLFVDNLYNSMFENNYDALLDNLYKEYF